MIGQQVNKPRPPTGCGWWTGLPFSDGAGNQPDGEMGCSIFAGVDSLLYKKAFGNYNKGKCQRKEAAMRVNVINIETESTDQLISLLKKGLSTESFDQLKTRLNVSDSKLASIVQISNRTLNRRRVKGRLRADESERVLRLARIYDQAVDVFGSDEAATSWLKHPARGLGGAIPLEYADTAPGAEEVMMLLGRIAHGAFPG